MILRFGSLADLWRIINENNNSSRNATYRNKSSLLHTAVPFDLLDSDIRRTRWCWCMWPRGSTRILAIACIRQCPGRNFRPDKINRIIFSAIRHNRMYLVNIGHISCTFASLNGIELNENITNRPSRIAHALCSLVPVDAVTVVVASVDAAGKARTIVWSVHKGGCIIEEGFRPNSSQKN